MGKQLRSARHNETKTWGSEDWVVNKPEYCGKVLYINPGMRGSLHYHLKKDETFLLMNGVVHIAMRDRRGVDSLIALFPGDSLHIPAGQMHQIINPMKIEAVLVEFSTQHFEDDSYRVEVGTK